MNQPPRFGSAESGDRHPAPPPLPPWRRPPGVAPGTWDYVNERTIADHYDAFVADTPLCDTDSQLLLQCFPGPADDRPAVILDLGCGSGRSSLLLADRGYDVVAVDLSQHMLRALMAKAADRDFASRIHPVHANLAQLDCLADHCADHAICLFSTIGMIQGRNFRRQMLSRVSRAVRSDGTLLLHVHNRWAALREYRGVRRLLASLWNSSRQPDTEFGDATYAYRGLQRMFMHRFSRREIVCDLQHAGWEIQSIWPIAIDGSRVDNATMIPGGYLLQSINRQ